MKKIVALFAVVLLVLTACGNNDDEKSESSKDNQKSSKDTKSETTESKAIDEKQLEEFAESLYEANKRSEIEHFDTLANSDVQTVINRQFQGANTEKGDRYDKTVNNVKLYKATDNKNNYLVTLELKARDTKEKKITWLQKTVEFKVKDNKITDFQEIGDREIFNEQS